MQNAADLADILSMRGIRTYAIWNLTSCGFFTKCEILVRKMWLIGTNSSQCERGSYKVWENMGVCPRLEFDNIFSINCLRYAFYINGAFEFLCNYIANLWRHVWYHYHTLGYPVIIISKVIVISCNGRRNDLWNNYIIDKFVDTINGFVCIRIVDGHSFLWHGTSIFKRIFCTQSNFESKFEHVAVIVKIPFQHKNYPYM